MLVIKKIIIPGRIQTDTAIAIFLLRTFGSEKFLNINDAEIEINSNLEGINKEDESILLLDIGDGEFDHHNKQGKITASSLVAENLGVAGNPSIAKLLALAERCDVYGKGIISEDAIDKAFGIPGIIVSLNRKYENNPNKVIQDILPVLDAHYKDEKHRAEDLPNILEDKKQKGEFYSFEVVQRNKKIKVAVLVSDDSVMPGFLRSSAGGANDVVAQWMTSGHINIITKQVKRIDLRSLVALIRKSEAILKNENINDMEYLSSGGRIKEIAEWYYDTATNSLQNGGINPRLVSPTKITKDAMKNILQMGLSESLWKPSSNNK